MVDFDFRHTMLKLTLFELISRHNSDLELAGKLWIELVQQYSIKKKTLSFLNSS